jgi:hypothetical protein
VGSHDQKKDRGAEVTAITAYFRPFSLALIVLLTIPACIGPMLPYADSAGSVESDETVIAGKIVISPPLDESEQTLTTIRSHGCCITQINPSADRYKNKIILLTDTKPRSIQEPEFSDYAGRIEAPIGDVFYVRAKNGKSLYVNRSEILMDVNGGGAEKAVLPSGYKIDIRPGDRAVYIGTIKYYRDEFFTVHRVEIIDDYERVNAAFRKKFGRKLVLRRALVAGGKNGGK